MTKSPIIGLVFTLLFAAGAVFFAVDYGFVQVKNTSGSGARGSTGSGQRDTDVERLRTRVADLTSERDYLAPHYSNVLAEIDRCVSGGPFLNQHLDVPILALTAMQVKAGVVSKLLAETVSFDAAMLAPQNVDLASKIDISVDDRTLSIALDSPADGPRPVDILLVVNRADGGACGVDLRLTFFPPDKPSIDGYEVVGIMGRSGVGYGTFSLPYGTDYHDGFLYVSDCSNEIVQRFSGDGLFMGGFSGFGTRFGLLDTPADLKVFDGRIYVVEERNHRYQVFDLDGKPIDLFGAFADATADPLTNPGKFNNPLGIAVTAEQVVVVDYANNRLQSFDHEGNLNWISANEDGDPFKWNGPYYIEHDQAMGRFVVSNRGANELAFVSMDGRKLGAVTGVLDYPHEVAVDGAGDIYVADTNNHSLYIYRGPDRAPKRLNFPDKFGLPNTVAVNGDGRVAVGFVGAGAAYLLMLDPIGAERAKSPGAVQPPPEDMMFQTAIEPGALTAHNPSTAALYSQFCASCHDDGQYGAPVRGNVEDWERFPREMDQLLELAIVGNKAMIPRGGCTECSDEQLMELIEFVVPKSWAAN